MFKFVMFQIPRKTEQWLKALWAAFIGGCATSFLTALGVTAEHMFNINTVPTFTPGQLGHMVLFGGLVGAALYLKQSPVPPDSGNTEQFVKPIDSTQKQP